MNLVPIPHPRTGIIKCDAEGIILKISPALTRRARASAAGTHGQDPTDGPCPWHPIGRSRISQTISAPWSASSCRRIDRWQWLSSAQ